LGRGSLVQQTMRSHTLIIIIIQGEVICHKWGGLIHHFGVWIDHNLENGLLLYIIINRLHNKDSAHQTETGGILPILISLFFIILIFLILISLFSIVYVFKTLHFWMHKWIPTPRALGLYKLSHSNYNHSSPDFEQNQTEKFTEKKLPKNSQKVELLDYWIFKLYVFNIMNELSNYSLYYKFKSRGSRICIHM